jgi:DNA helicase II / ATP-dependent DNA helicase PcrA
MSGWTKLNKDQLDAVEYCDGPEIIIAGAGTGKTTVLKEKIAYLVENKGLDPQNILALTFTNKAIADLRRKLKNAEAHPKLAERADELNVFTFHSFCMRIINEGKTDAVLPRLDQFVDDAAEAMLVGDLINRHNLDHLTTPHDPIDGFKRVTDTLNQAKDELATVEKFRQKALEEAEQYRQLAETTGNKKDRKKYAERAEILPQLAELYELYMKVETERGFYDQSDLHRYLISILEQDKSFLNELQERFKYILVDEFQDVNFAQIRLCELLGSRDGKICVVGDDDQAIYRFRGASFASFGIFKDIFSTKFPDTYREFVLGTNYRSNTAVLDGANALILANGEFRMRAERQLESSRNPELDKWGKFRLCLSQDERVQAKEIADDMEARVAEFTAAGAYTDDGGHPFGHFAVLYRSHRAGREVLAELERRGIPFAVVGGRDLFTSPETNALWSILRLLVDENDGIAFFRALSGSGWRVPFADLYRLMQYRRRQNLTAMQALEYYADVEDLSPEGAAELGRAKHGMALLRDMILDAPLDRLIREVLRLTGMLGNLLVRDDAEAEARVAELSEFLALVNDFVEINLHAGLLQLLDYLRYASRSRVDTAGAQPSQQAVSCLTIHAAKGLEFDHVYLVGFHSANFPVSERHSEFRLPEGLWNWPLPPGEINIVEERRLFYVAMTRAKHTLTLAGIESKLVDESNPSTKHKSKFYEELEELNALQHFADYVEWSGKVEDETSYARDILLEGREVYTDRLWHELAASMRLAGEYGADAKPEVIAGQALDGMRGVLWQMMMLRERELGREASPEERVRLASALGLDPATAGELLCRIPHRDQLCTTSATDAIPLEKSLDLSYTAINTYTQCPFLFRVTQLLKLPGVTNNSLAFGSLVHSVAEKAGRMLMESGSAPTIEQWHGWLADEYKHARFEHYVDRSSYSRDASPSLDFLLEGYLACHGKPFAIEQNCSFGVGNHTVHGRIDWVAELPEGLWIVDFKSGASTIKSNKQIGLGNDLQLGCYVLGAENEWKDRKVAKVSYLIIDKSGDAAVQERSCTDMPALKDYTLRVINEAIEGIVSRRFEPNPQNCHFCDIKDLCPLEG